MGDRTNLVFQNTQVTRGTATVVVTATGESTQMGRIADMVTSTQAVALAAPEGARRDDQGVRTRRVARGGGDRDLRDRTRPVVRHAWRCCACRPRSPRSRRACRRSCRRCCPPAPSGWPSPRRSSSRSADVETLGGTTVINSDKTGTLTLNAMTVTTMLAGGEWFEVEGGGYSKIGAILGVAGSELPDFRRLALGLALCSDATVSDDGAMIGDPTEAALVVLAAKMGVDAEQTRSALERRAEVPFDSEYKFMATFHDRPDWVAGGILKEPHFMTVKGAPDIVVGPLQPSALARAPDPDRRGPGGDPRGQPTAVGERASRARIRGPRARRRRDVGGDRRSDGRRLTIWFSSRWSESSTRSAARPRTPSTWRSPPASTCE